MQILEEKRDFPTDLLLVYLVRVQVICNKIAAAPWNDTFGILSTKVPSDFYTKALKSQLEDLKRSIPVELQSNGNYFFSLSSVKFIYVINRYLTTSHSWHSTEPTRAQPEYCFFQEYLIRSKHASGAYRKPLDLFDNYQSLVCHIFLPRLISCRQLPSSLHGNPCPNGALHHRTFPGQYF